MDEYKDKGYRLDQLYEIREILEDGLDVSSINSPKYNINQIRQIKDGLQENIDVKHTYASPYIDEKHMLIIRGLQNEIDLTPYIDGNIYSNLKLLYNDLLKKKNKE